jgi:hypothetical protein
MSKNDLKAPGVAKALEKTIMKAIDDYCVETYGDGHRTHLGASLIGEECSRYLWYTFRWVKEEEFSGRMYRLFNRGHKEEDRFIEWLEGIGCTVWALAEDGSQHRISGVQGHFGGSLDGVVKLPEEWGIDEPLLLEFKTSATGSPFKGTVDKGMKVSKPKHWAQTCTYGMKYNLNYVLYMIINKNDDSIHLEVTKLDHNFGKQMEMKAEKIITSQEPPPKISQSASYMRCKWCHFSDICHNNGVAEKNCRSCKHAVPGENKSWLCSLNDNAQIPADFIPKGCDAHKSITLVEE